MLSVIIPAYNEEDQIQNTIAETEKVLKGFDYEIIVIDDGSTDSTYKKAVESGSPRVRVLKKQNGGKGSAVRFGFENSKGDFISFIDADMDLHPKHIPLYFKIMQNSGADVIVGSKRHPLSKLNYPFKRKVLSDCYYLLVKFLFGLSVKDTQAGVKLFKRQVLEQVIPKMLCKKYAFDLEMLVIAKHKGFKIAEAPVELNWHRLESRIKIKDILKIAVDTAAIFYRLNIIRYYD